MKAATAQAKALLREAYEVKAIPKITAEWEHNRFSPFVYLPEDVNQEYPVTVSPAETDDYEWLSVFDLQSLALPNRPGTGVAKTRFDANGVLRLAGKYRDTPQESRFYLPGPEDAYKYWSSQQKSSILQTDGYNFEDAIEITLLYNAPIVANKVVVGFETSYAAPQAFTVQVTGNGSTWATIAVNPPLDNKGRVNLWMTDSGGWLVQENLLNPAAFNTDTFQRIRGVRLVVTSIDQPDSRLDVIQLGARLEADLSDYIESYQREFEISDRSMIAPLGGASSNTASVRLDNMDGLFNNDSELSPFFGLIGKKVKFTCDLEYELPTYEERIREFTMYSDSWGGQDELSSGVELKDSSIFLQEVTVPNIFWGNGPEVPVNKFASYPDASGKYTVPEKASNPSLMTVGSIIWQLMDVLGFTNYEYSRKEIDRGQIVPYFWPDDKKTAWAQISEIAEGTQTAVYFDEYDVMQIKSREAIFGGETIDWNLDAVKAGAKLPDIIDLQQNDELVANEVQITYKPTKFSDFNNGLPKMETVWEPEENTVMLRASNLQRDLLTTDTDLWISYNETAFWPYAALVNIRGENIRYEGKEYAMRVVGGGIEYRIIKNQDEKAQADKDSDPFRAYQNSWTGKLKITERGVAGTPVKTHRIRPYNYNVLIQDQQGSKFFEEYASNIMKYYDGYMRMNQPAGLGPYDYTLALHETAVFSNNFTVGTRMRFPSEQRYTNKLALGGLFFGGNYGTSGYYLEISPTEYINSENRYWRHELSLVVKGAAAKGFNAWVRGGDYKGAGANLLYDTWFDVDVVHTTAGTGAYAIIQVYINGVLAASWDIPWVYRVGWASAGKFGVHTRSYTNVDYEYLYSYNNEISGLGITQPGENNFLDLKRGGFASGQFDREVKYSIYKNANLGPYATIASNPKVLQTAANIVIDEYAPVVHEMREFEVKFDDDSIPTVHSFLYYSNSSQVMTTDYHSDPFGARFTLVNTSRQNAVLKGEDKITFGADNAVDQNLFVYGRVLKQEDDQVIIKDDKVSIRRNGITSLEFDNKFVQTKESADSLADWVLRLWAGGVDEIEVEIFGNPFIQLGDLVTINYPLKDMYPSSHRYFVVSLKNEFDKGLRTTLVLRRART